MQQETIKLIHAKWIIKDGTINCSNCKKCLWSNWFMINVVYSFKYCPTCGAKMDLT